MKIYGWVTSHRRSILFLFTVLALAGFASAYKLPVTLFPTVDFPRVVLTLDAGDRPAEQMEVQVTIPVEEAVRRVPGVKNVRSTTSRGSAEVSINFGWGTDMAMATAQISASVTQKLPSLPVGTQILTRRMDPTVFPVIAYSLTASHLSPTQLYDLGNYQIRPLLSSIEGIARVQVIGGAPEEYRVNVDPARLASYGLGLDDVSKALSAANVITAVGRLEDHYKLNLIVTNTTLEGLEAIRDTVLRSGDNGLVRLRDVATVSDSEVPQWTRVTADGHDAVLLNIYQQPGSNSVQIARDVNARIASYQAQLPAGVKLAEWYDQSRLVLDSAASVRDAILIGICLAAVVLFAFLRNVRTTLIAMLVVPAALASTVVLLSALDMSFNIMTLGGMAAAVGLIVDDAIVMIEHIEGWLLREGKSGKDVMQAAAELIRPLAGSSASTIIVFLPLAFLSGVTGAFFKALSLTMVSALALSFLLTWLAVPLLAERFLRHRPHASEERSSWLHLRYEKTLGHLLKRPLWVFIIIIPLMFSGWFAYRGISTGFMPSIDEGGFILDYRSPPGTSLTETDRLLRQVEDILKQTPDVANYSRRTGIQLGGGITEANEGDFLIRLKDGKRRSVYDVMDEVRAKVEQTVPGLEIELAQLMEDLIGDLTAVPQPIEVKIYSDDSRTLAALARKTAAALNGIPGVVDVRDGINPAGDALEIHVDRTKAALEGLDPDRVAQELSSVLSGTVATEVRRGPKMVGVRVWIPQDYRSTDGDIGRLLLRAPDGHNVPVGRIATIVKVTGQPQIVRENLKRMVAVTARISGVDMGTAVGKVKQLMDQPGFLPHEVYYEMGGLYAQQVIAFRGLIAVFLADIALMLLLLLFMYERFRVPVAVLTVPLLSLGAVFAGLRLSGIELNISSMMGMIMIIGIVTEGAIFYFSEYQSLRARGSSLDQALIQAGKNRMRPIAMTTLVTILTLLPLALALGRGSEMQQPLAVAIVSGLLLQLPLILLVMPVIFRVMEHRRVGEPHEAAAG